VQSLESPRLYRSVDSIAVQYVNYEIHFLQAMHALYDTSSSQTTDKSSMITSWITTHGKSSLSKLDQLIISKDKPIKLLFGENKAADRFEATIDENLNVQDKLSQVCNLE